MCKKAKERFTKDTREKVIKKKSTREWYLNTSEAGGLQIEIDYQKLYIMKKRLNAINA